MRPEARAEQSQPEMRSRAEAVRGERKGATKAMLES